MLLPGRNGEDPNAANDYRYSFQGMEKDNEVSGDGNSYTTEFRQYDPRLGRWKSLDPLMAQFTSLSPYQAFNNNPIIYIDPQGSNHFLPGGDPSETLPNGGNRLTNRMWNSTPSKTSTYEGVGGMKLHIPNNEKSSVKYFVDGNRDGYLGFPKEKGGAVYQGASESRVERFRGQDGQLYIARFLKDGTFNGYHSKVGTKRGGIAIYQEYDNKKYTANDILEEKASQAFEYIGNSYGYRDFNPPTFFSDEYLHVNNEFTFDGEKYLGTIHGNTKTTVLNTTFKYIQELEYVDIYITKSDALVTKPTYSYVVEILSDHRNGQEVDESITFTFSKKAEWKRFIRHIGDKYGIDDNSRKSTAGMKPSEALKK